MTQREFAHFMITMVDELPAGGSESCCCDSLSFFVVWLKSLWLWRLIYFWFFVGFFPSLSVLTISLSLFVAFSLSLTLSGRPYLDYLLTFWWWLFLFWKASEERPQLIIYLLYDMSPGWISAMNLIVFRLVDWMVNSLNIYIFFQQTHVILCLPLWKSFKDIFPTEKARRESTSRKKAETRTKDHLSRTTFHTNILNPNITRPDVELVKSFKPFKLKPAHGREKSQVKSENKTEKVSSKVKEFSLLLFRSPSTISFYNRDYFLFVPFRRLR